MENNKKDDPNLLVYNEILDDALLCYQITIRVEFTFNYYVNYSDVISTKF